MSLDGFWDYISARIEDYDQRRLDNHQDDFVLYLDLTRRLSWDIPSAIFCAHLDREVPMHHRTEPGEYPATNPLFYSWQELEAHFKEVHGLDLTDPRINWSFDT